jgi:hypothetical protein
MPEKEAVKHAREHVRATWGIWLAGRFTFNPFVVSAWRYLRWGIAILFAVLAVNSSTISGRM